jgi:hypothetical protein
VSPVEIIYSHDFSHEGPFLRKGKLSGQGIIQFIIHMIFSDKSIPKIKVDGPFLAEIFCENGVDAEICLT